MLLGGRHADGAWDSRHAAHEGPVGSQRRWLAGQMGEWEWVPGGWAHGGISITDEGDISVTDEGGIGHMCHESYFLGTLMSTFDFQINFRLSI